MPNLELLFVYGTLKRGGKYHQEFLNEAKFLTEASTVAQYDMYSNGEYPFIFENGSARISGEIYQLTLKNLIKIDRLEEIPEEYIRKKIKVKSSDKEMIAWSYIAQPKLKNKNNIFIADGYFIG